MEIEQSRSRTAALTLGLFPFLLVGAALPPFQSSPSTSTPIKHVIVIVQENHTFFNYFGAFPGVLGGVSDATCMPLPQGGCLNAFPTNVQKNKGTMRHTESFALEAFDGGAMDKFLLANNNTNVMSYYVNGSVLGYYWGLASHYTLFDQFFSSYMSYSLPNHWAAVAGDAPLIAINGTHKALDTTQATNELINEASAINTMLEFVNQNSNLPVRYYDSAPAYANISQALQVGGPRYVDNFFNPNLEKADTYTTLRSDFVPRTQIFTDISKGNLPALSWVIPNAPISEHPPENISKGVQWVKSVVQAVMNSKYWSDTAIFYVTDDWGGFYDPVVPPIFDGQQLGFRVAAVLVSPYSARGIVHAQFSFESILKFIDYNWNLPYLNGRVGDSNSLLAAFNFTQAPLHPWEGAPLTGSQIQAAISTANLNLPGED